MSESDRLEEIFSESLKLSDAEERRQYLHQACGGIIVLAEHVFSFKSAAQDAGSFLETPVWRAEQAQDSIVEEGARP